MSTFLLIITLLLTNTILLIPIKKIIIENKITDDFIFFYLSNIILTFAFLLFFSVLSNFTFAFYIAFFHMIFSYLLIYHIKNILGKYNLYSLPFFILWVYIFSKILICYLF